MMKCLTTFLLVLLGFSRFENSKAANSGDHGAECFIECLM